MLAQTHYDWEAVASYADLPNVSGSPTQSARLVAGMRCYTTDTQTTWVCRIATPGAAVWDPAASSIQQEWNGQDTAQLDPVVYLDGATSASLAVIPEPTFGGFNVLRATLAAGTPAQGSATWYFTEPLGFQSLRLRFVTALDATGSPPAGGDLLSAGLAFGSDPSAGNALAFVHVSDGTVGTTESVEIGFRDPGGGGGGASIALAGGSYIRTNTLDILGALVPWGAGDAPSFLATVSSQPVPSAAGIAYGTQSVDPITGPLALSWGPAAKNRVGITLTNRGGAPLASNCSVLLYNIGIERSQLGRIL